MVVPGVVTVVVGGVMVVVPSVWGGEVLVVVVMMVVVASLAFTVVLGTGVVPAVVFILGLEAVIGEVV